MDSRNTDNISIETTNPNSTSEWFAVIIKAAKPVAVVRLVKKVAFPTL